MSSAETKRQSTVGFDFEQENAELWDEERRLEILVRLIIRAEQGGEYGKDDQKSGVLEPDVGRKVG